jgi:hypothetical protein
LYPISRVIYSRFLDIYFTTILPNVVGRMTAKRKVASSNLVTDDSSTCNPYCSCGLCGYLGRNPGEGVKTGE